MKYRIEKDGLGEVQIPAEAYYGINTYRAANNFAITKRSIPRQMIKALAIVKKAATKANLDAELLQEKKAKAIMLACDEILNGKLHGQFITDLIQGGAGNSINMNTNEIIANRANEILGGKKGEYTLVHPIDHVNMSQTSNDVIPTAGKIAIIKQIKKMIVEVKKLQNNLYDKAKQYGQITKLSYSHLQESVPITMEQEFNAYASVLGRDLKRLDEAIDCLSEVNMGATAIGTGLNANEKYRKKVITYLNKYSGEEIKAGKDLIDLTRNFDCFVWASSAIKSLAIDLSKLAGDLRLLSSSFINEVNLPKLQEGSTIVPGKYNPVIPEVVNQVAFYVIGLDVTVSRAVEAGQLDLNVFSPVILMALFDELTNLRHAVRTLNTLAIENIEINVDACKDKLSTNAYATALIPHLGFELTCKLVDESNQKNKSLQDLLIEKKLMTKDAVNAIFNQENLTTPGIKGEEFLKK